MSRRVITMRDEIRRVFIVAIWLIIISNAVLFANADTTQQAQSVISENLPTADGQWFTAWYILYTGNGLGYETTQHYSLVHGSSVLNYQITWPYDGLALYEVHIYALEYATGANNDTFYQFIPNTLQDLLGESNILTFVVDDRIVENTRYFNNNFVHGYKEGIVNMDNRYIYVHEPVEYTLSETETVTLQTSSIMEGKAEIQVQTNKLLKKLGLQIQGGISVTYIRQTVEGYEYQSSFQLSVYKYIVEISSEGQFIEHTHLVKYIEGYPVEQDIYNTYLVPKVTKIVTIYSSVSDAIAQPGN